MRKNKIKSLKKDDGQVTKSTKEMASMTKTCFQQLYAADPSVQPQELLSLVENRVTPQKNDSLCKEFTPEEIGDALFAAQSTRAGWLPSPLFPKELGYSKAGCSNRGAVLF
jgi:hypothetical protein